MDRLQNLQRREAQRVLSQVGLVRIGVVTSYDPQNYAAKVTIQPEGFETGFLPVTTPWSGNGWGMFCPPTAGDVVDVHFQEGGKQAGFIALRHYGDQLRPLSVPSGEFWVVHKSGASFTLKNDGTANMSDGHGASITMNGDGTASITASHITSTAPRWDHVGQFNATQFYAEGVSTIPDARYRTGLGLTQDGYITTKGGMIVAIQEAE